MAEGRNLLDTVVGIVSLAGLLAGGIWYATGLQNQLESAQREISELRTRLEKVSPADGNIGPRGPKGDTGDMGPQGPRGPAGEPGPAIDQAEIMAMISRLAPARASASQQSGNVPTVAETSLDTGCRLNKEFADLRTFSVRTGIEVCDATGRVLAIVDKVTTDGFPDYIGVNFKVPGSKDVFCWKEATSCQVPWLPGKAFYIERLSRDVDGGVAVLRRKG